MRICEKKQKKSRDALCVSAFVLLSLSHEALHDVHQLSLAQFCDTLRSNGSLRLCFRNRLCLSKVHVRVTETALRKVSTDLRPSCDEALRSGLRFGDHELSVRHCFSNGTRVGVDHLGEGLQRSPTCDVACCESVEVDLCVCTFL